MKFFVGLYSYCKEFHSLPNAGGVLDQDGYLMWGLGEVSRAVSEKIKADSQPKKVT